LFIQIQGIEDLYVFDEGSVTVDTNGSIGTTTPARVSLNSLHVQDNFDKLVGNNNICYWL
jgi:hypothetical protein